MKVQDKILKSAGKVSAYLLFFISLAFLSSIISCGEDAGLGSSVDTESPKLSISYPPDAAAIKGQFVFAGTCSDDKGVESVTVTVTSIDDSSFKPLVLSATVKDSLTWSVDVNKLTDDGYPLVDGKYKLSAIATDKTGRTSGENSRQFEIDNTAPVFVIKKTTLFPEKSTAGFSEDTTNAPPSSKDLIVLSILSTS